MVGRQSSVCKEIKRDTILVELIGVAIILGCPLMDWVGHRPKEN